MPFDDAAFDAILCSHVLEHVEEDRVAMSELARVLRPGGWLLVLVPLDVNRPETYEDPAMQSEEDRTRAFLQHDHVRLYAPDIADRLAETGLEVRAVRSADEFGGAAAARYGLLADETVFHCAHPSSSEV